MTTNKDFKRRVRDRMERTGERYTTARAHLLDDDSAPQNVGGRQPDVAAAANALARAGVHGPGGGPFDEVDLLGLAGGIGFMVAIFEYADFGPTMTITTRTVSMPDPFVEFGLSLAGADHEVLHTGSAKIARASMDEALAAGHQVLVSVEAGALPYNGSDGSWLGAGPCIIGVLAQDGDDYLVDDRSVEPLRITGDALMAARGVVAKSRHRSIVITGPTAGHDPVAATRRALARTAEGYDESPAKSFVNNVGTNGLRTWASRLTAGNAKGWAKVFAEPAHLHYGLRRVAECIDHELTAPAASRPLFASWLRRAAAITDVAEVAAQAHAFDAAAERWQAVSDLAANADPSIAAAVDGIERARALLDEQGSAARDAVRAIRAEVHAERDNATLGGAEAGVLFAEMADHANAIAEIERTALDTLEALVAS